MNFTPENIRFPECQDRGKCGFRSSSTPEHAGLCLVLGWRVFLGRV